MSEPRAGLVALLEEGRTREKAQTLFYRALAARAHGEGDDRAAERLNELHADEQHHLSRLTARLLEMGGVPADLRGMAAPDAGWPAWEEIARAREGQEVEWYRRALVADLDGETRATLEEILHSELRHRDELGGKWMSA